MHKQVRIRHGEMEADVDEEIAPLILELWRAGVETISSCQNYLGFGVWIIVSAASAAAFDRLLRGYRRPHKRKLFTEPNGMPRAGDCFYHFACPAEDLPHLQKHVRRVARKRHQR